MPEEKKNNTEIINSTEKKKKKVGRPKSKKEDKLVVYDNTFNRLTLHVLNSIELNILSYFLHCLKEKGENEVIVSMAEIKKYCKIKDRGNNILINGWIDKNGEKKIGLLDSLKKKILTMKIPVEFNKAGIKFTGEFNLFSGYAVSEDKKNFYLRIDGEYKFLINNITRYFTQYKLDDFTNLKSSYSKLLFQLLKQWNSVGELEMSIMEFREKLGVPKSYRMSAVNSRVLVNIEKELPEYFKNFKIEKIKQGKTIAALKFTWDNLKKIQNDNEMIEEAVVLEPELLYSKALERAINKCKRNHFVGDNKVLTEKNIKILLKEFEEKDIITGLEKIYKVAKQPITELNYFKKVILSIKKERDSIVQDKFEKMKEAEIIEVKDKKSEIQEDLFKIQEKIILTKEEYEEKFEKEYEEFLKQNKARRSKFSRNGFEKMFIAKYQIKNEQSEEEKFQEFLKNNYDKLKNRSLEEQKKIYQKFINLL